jgi:hypothetical protein
VSDPSAPEILSELTLSGFMYDARVEGDDLVLALGRSGAATYDIRDRSAPLATASLAAKGEVLEAVFRDRLMFTADWIAGITVADSGGSGLQVLSTYQPGGFARSLALDGDFMYAAHAQLGVAAYQLGPLDPTPASLSPVPGQNIEVAAEGGYAFASGGEAGIWSIDMADPSAPGPPSFSSGGLAQELAVAGERLLMARAADGVEFYDISEPAVPFLAGSIDTPGSTTALAVDGDIVYLADGEAGVQVIDMSNPAAPRALLTIPTPAPAIDVTVLDARLYVAIGLDGVAVFDVSNLAAPALLGTVGASSTRSPITLVAADDDFVYAGQIPQAVLVIDASEPARPLVVARHTLEWDPQDLAAAEGRLYVAAGSLGTLVMEPEGDADAARATALAMPTSTAVPSPTPAPLATGSDSNSGSSVWSYFLLIVGVAALLAAGVLLVLFRRAAAA